MSLILVKGNNQTDNALYFIRHKAPHPARHLNRRFYLYVDAWDTCPSSTQRRPRLQSVEYRKSTRFERRVSWLMPFSKRVVRPRCAAAAPLKSHLQLRRGIHRSPIECNLVINHYLTYSLSMNERLDNVLARICNWNPRERARETYESHLWAGNRNSLNAPELWNVCRNLKRERERGTKPSSRPDAVRSVSRSFFLRVC